MSDREALLRGWLSHMRALHARGSGTSNIGSSYTSDVVFAGYVPGEVTKAHGKDDVVEVLARWHSGPADIVSWSSTEFADDANALSGARLDVEWRFEASAERHRRSHYVQLGDAGVHRHVVFSARPVVESVPTGSPGPALAALYASARDCRTVAAGTSATPMQQITTASGATVFAKWFVPGGDWQARLTADPGREAKLWAQGWLDRLPAGIGHPILAAEEFGDGMWVTISRDLTANLLRNKRLTLWRSVRGPSHDETAFGLSLLGQASGLIPALLSDVVDYPGPAHRAFSRTKLAWWTGIIRQYEHLLNL